MDYTKRKTSDKIDIEMNNDCISQLPYVTPYELLENTDNLTNIINTLFMHGTPTVCILSSRKSLHYLIYVRKWTSCRQFSNSYWF